VATLESYAQRRRPGVATDVALLRSKPARRQTWLRALAVAGACVQSHQQPRPRHTHVKCHTWLWYNAPGEGASPPWHWWAARDPYCHDGCAK
jgi:hypothetical protein